MLEVHALEASYGPSQVLFGVSFRIESGKVATLLGRNGMGKTTTVRSIMGMLPCKAGSISAQLSALEADLSDDVLRITGAWDEKAAAIDSVPVRLERTDVQVAQLVLAWVPVS